MLQPDQPPNSEASGVIWTEERDSPETRLQSLSKYVSLSVSEGSMNNESLSSQHNSYGA